MKMLRAREWARLYAAWKLEEPHLANCPSRMGLVRGCACKVLYESRKEADAVAKMLPPFPGKAIHVYWYRICKHHHIGNSRSKREGVALYSVPPSAPNAKSA